MTETKQIHLKPSDFKLLEDLKPVVAEAIGKTDPTMPDVLRFLVIQFRKHSDEQI